MKLTHQIRISKHILRLLKVNEITLPIGRTPKGNLGISFNDKNDDFTMMLDSVPLSTANSLEDENNIELKKMLTKYLFENEETVQFPSHLPVAEVSQDNIGPVEKKKGGRPVGSKNKVNGKKTH